MHHSRVHRARILVRDPSCSRACRRRTDTYRQRGSAVLVAPSPPAPVRMAHSDAPWRPRDPRSPLVGPQPTLASDRDTTTPRTTTHRLTGEIPITHAVRARTTA